PGSPSPPRGSVLLLHTDHPESVPLPDLQRLAARLRTALSLPVALRLGGPDPLRSLYLASHARAAGCGAVLLECQPLAEGLRAFLAHPLDPAEEWVRWLQLRAPVPGQYRDTLLATIRAAPVALDLTDLCSRIGTPMRTLAHRLRQAGLPKLERWYDGSRVLHAELQLQRDPCLGVDRVAEQLGYADDLSFSNRAYRLFGVTPVTSRRLLGLEWRFREWWLRARR
ncbi:MAG TPA: helix-turn-helix domain-containing protein, partial [Longimicrobiaceae bacterium]|nr:helix-turn-helix domain-containing protein [Longimicrobiaceae bacterium]